MTYDKIFKYAGHFLASAADFLTSPLGVVIAAMLLTLGVLAIWEDLSP